MGFDLGDLRRKAKSFWKKKGIKDKMHEILIAKEGAFKALAVKIAIEELDMSMPRAKEMSDFAWKIAKEFIEQVL